MSTPIRFFTDEHVAAAIANGLRKRGIDVLTVSEAGLLGVDDRDLLSFVREEERVIVTHDRGLPTACSAGAQASWSGICPARAFDW